MFKFASTIGQRGSKAFLKSVSNNNVFSKNSCKFLKELTQQSIRNTTVLSVRKGNDVVIMGDGQITQGQHIKIKNNANKLRKIGDDVIAGFAGSTADAMALFEKLENRLEEYSGQLTRACIEMAKDWRLDKALRHLDAVMIVADKHITLLVSGDGNVIEPASGVFAIGSGGPYAAAAARALMDKTDLDAFEIAKTAMEIAADMDVYTNSNFTTLSLKAEKLE